MLKVKDLNVSYGSIRALWDVSLEVNKNEIVTLIGANGAGKTTLMMTISGFVKPRSGIIEFLGSRIERLRPYKILGLGIAQVPQGRHLFGDMTVRENLELGAYRSRKDSKLMQRLEEVFGFFEVLRDRQSNLARFLSGGEQQMLAFGRALMSNAKFLLFDEPSAGLAPIMVKKMAEIIRELRVSKGLTNLIVEQNAILALELADTGYVLETGRVVATGKASDLAASDLVKKAYLGI